MTKQSLEDILLKVPLQSLQTLLWEQTTEAPSALQGFLSSLHGL